MPTLDTPSAERIAGQKAVAALLVKQGVNEAFANALVEMQLSSYFMVEGLAWFPWADKQYGPTHYHELAALLLKKVPAGQRDRSAASVDIDAEAIDAEAASRAQMRSKVAGSF